MGPRGLRSHASGTLAEAFGPGWADLDRYTPRVRMPEPPLLLVDRVIAVEGSRGELGPARIITEYDVPSDPRWSADGLPPAFVVVESGQADLLLVSYLGIDEECRGQRVYRLLDCDLTFLGDRPAPGTTLRHDIRIDRFARLGQTTLFYFRYDCATVDGQPVLQMRNGCAGFFTPEELASPRGIDGHSAAHWASSIPAPLAGPTPTALSDDAVAALSEGRFGDALGSGHAGADGASLTLPRDRSWRCVHRVIHLSISGAPHGLGEIIVEQDLHDDDWFNGCHFRDDPCMPGTLMFEGCLQAVQTWLLGLGVASQWPNGRFEPLLGIAARLRCRGQVVPGHRRLTYHARIKEASLSPDPVAIADVVLSVDGIAVVRADDVGVRIVTSGGATSADAVSDSADASPGDDAREPPLVADHARVLSFSVGSAVVAFGPRYVPYDGPGRRCARMPGPPLLQMSRVLSVEGPAGEIAADRSVTIAYDVPTDAWFWRIGADRGPMPFAILLETALQPCGWLTAWQGSGLADGADGGLYFRNLGGTGTQHAEVWPHTGTLITEATQTAISSSGAMTVMRFDVVVRAGDETIFTCETQFGYFTRSALAQQKGLPGIEPLPGGGLARSLADHPTMPRADWRMLDHLQLEEPAGGRAGLGRYVASKQVDPGEWFFVAHFWLDPVMPGSLGLEAMLQLARYVHHERTGALPPGTRLRPLALGRPLTWIYRGQVLQHVEQITVELEVQQLSPGALAGTAVLRADGVPIYRLEGLALERTDAPIAAPPEPPSVVRRGAPAALLDSFSVEGDRGFGHLLLDPAAHPWLDQHRPTLTVAAVPLAFAAELAAEAATLLRPGLEVIGIPQLEALRWIEVEDTPVTLAVIAVAEAGSADTVRIAVSLAIGAEVRMRAIVQLGPAWGEAPEPQRLEVPEAGWGGEAFFSSGRTFHGPVLQGMVSLDRLGAGGAIATLRASVDRQLLGSGELPALILDPLLLDSATHPMLSGEPERWAPETIPPGRIAYPVGIEDLSLHGPRPTGEIRATVALVAADARRLVFDVELAGFGGIWCRYRWLEAVLPGGPLLGLSPAQRRAFLWRSEPLPEVRIGRAAPGGWIVGERDLIEPLPGTLARLCCAPAELTARARADSPRRWDRRWLAAKEAVRSHLRQTPLGDLHPRELILAELQPDVLIVLSTPGLSADAYLEHLGPTRWRIQLRDTPGETSAQLVQAPTG